MGGEMPGEGVESLLQVHNRWDRPALPEGRQTL